MLALCIGAYFSIVLPLNTYFLFQQDLSIGIINAVVPFGIIFVLLTISVFVILRPLPLQLFSVVTIVILFLIVISYYNFYFSDYQGKIIGADADVMNQKHRLFEYIVLFVFLVGALYFRRKLTKNILTIIVFILIVNLINIFVLWFQSDAIPQKPVDTNSINSSFYNLSSKNNIIHLVLDGMQGSVFTKLLEEQSALSTSFRGFEFFPDAVTPSEVTYLAIPAILNGEVFDGEGSIKEYRQKMGMLTLDNNKKSSAPVLLNHLSQAGFSLDILTAPGSGMKEIPIYTHYYNTDFEVSDVASTGVNRLIDLVLIKILPWQGKQMVYRNGAWLFSSDDMTELPRANRAMAYLEDFGRNIQFNDQENTYKLIHLLTPHKPFTTSEDCSSQTAKSGFQAALNQAKCTMLAVTKLLEHLKSIGVYDNSLILINGDHGECVGYNMPNSENKNLPYCIGNSNPLLLIKRPDQNGHLAINEKQVELTDIPKSILQILNISNKISGNSFFENDSIIDRTRTFFRFKPNRIIASKLDRVDVIERFQIKGRLFDAESWEKTSVDQSLNFNELREGSVLDIDKIGKSDAAAWIRWNGQRPPDHIFILSEDERVTLKVGDGFLSFKFPDASLDSKLFLVDPVKKLKQEIQFD